MTQVLVLFDHLDAELTGAQKELLTLASTLGQVSVVTGEASPGDQVAVDGVGTVYVPQETILAPDAGLVDLVQAAVEQAQADVVLGSDMVDSVDVLARLAVRIDAGLITGAVSISGTTVTKSVLAGSYITTAQPIDGPLIATVRPNSVQAETAVGHAPQITVLPVAPSSSVEVLERSVLPTSGRPPLTEARVVVAAGRGVEGDLNLVEQLADELGAAVGASRVATDAGWVDHSAQVGQTGVIVSPQLYISVGISGAIQQKAGMQTAETIVAINKDEDAAVFEIADFGVVGDLNEVLPQAIEEIRRRRG
ncbi:electron transfer flavoprotein subunit alpha/FixB family protein [Garicola koreensis]|uniref:electron transfer flavoprotein subunit alpha/FixB family protein n=1 Tax=Garicola koreensis TaxID=1262554 RepID=UPI0031EB58B0